MRVTERMTSRNYLRSLNRTLSKTAESNRRLTSGMKYLNLSDDVAAGSRAVRADQRAFRASEQLSTIQDVTGQLETADNVLQDMNELLTDLHTKILNGVNMDDPTKRSAVAKEVESMKTQIVQFANAKFGDVFLFSGTNNKFAPFEVNKTTGKIEFNGVDVDKIYRDTDDGLYYYDAADGTKTEVPQNGDVYLDIGLGLKLDAGVVDQASAFKISFSGLDILGVGSEYGETAGEMSNNIYNLLGQIEDLLNTDDYDHDKVMALNDHLKARIDHLMTNETDLGTRVQFLDRMTDRLTDEVDTLEAMKKALVGTDSAQEATELKNHMAAYDACLAIGAELLQKSLLDFLR